MHEWQKLEREQIKNHFPFFSSIKVKKKTPEVIWMLNSMKVLWLVLVSTQLLITGSGAEELAGEVKP